MKNYISLFALLFCFSACKNTPDPAVKILNLEQKLAAKYDPADAKELVNAYRDAVKTYPDRHAENLQFLTKAADIQFFKFTDGVSAARFLDDAIAHHSDGKNLTEVIKLYAQIWNANLYKSAPASHLDPDDIDKMKTNLMRNTIWMDSALMRLDKKITASFSTGLDKTACREFIDISESYADILGKADPEKYFDLLNRAGSLAKTCENPQKAVALYQRLLENQPAAPKAGQVAFMLGYVYENDLKDLEKAKTAYENVSKNYPNDKDMVFSAKMAIKNLGKTPEEILKAAGVK